MRRLAVLGRRSVLWSLLFLATSLKGQQAPPIVAYVLDVTGNWQVEGQSGAAKAGQPLFAGAKLSTEWYNYANSITIVQNDDLSRTRITCEHSSKNPCLNPIVVRSAPSGPSTNQLKILLKTTFSLLVDKPPVIASHYSATLSRGKYVVIEKEDVASVDGEHGFSLTGVIPVLPAGTYTVDATSNDGKTPPLSIKIMQSTDGSWQSLPIPASGLCTIGITDSDGESRADLLFLFVPRAEYGAAKQKFDAVRGRTLSWEGPNAQADEHLFLRAVLLAMSQSS